MVMRHKTNAVMSSLQDQLLKAGLVDPKKVANANREKIRNLAEARKVLGNIRGTVILQIRRNGEAYVARVD